MICVLLPLKKILVVFRLFSILLLLFFFGGGGGGVADLKNKKFILKLVCKSNQQFMYTITPSALDSTSNPFLFQILSPPPSFLFLVRFPLTSTILKPINVCLFIKFTHKVPLKKNKFITHLDQSCINPLLFRGTFQYTQVGLCFKIEIKVFTFLESEYFESPFCLEQITLSNVTFKNE